MERVGNAIDSLRGKSLIWQETARLYNEIKGNSDFLRLAQMVKNFSGRVIRDIKDFIRSITATGGKTMAKLETVVQAAKQVSKEYAERKAIAKAERPILRGGDVDPVAALEFWHKEVKDTNEHAGYVPLRTGKVIGQMKNWLRELVAQGLTEEEIRHKITGYVRKWMHVPDRKRELQCVSAAGKPYKLRMSYTPNFDVFYAHRAAICPLLEETCEPGKFPDGTEREYVEYR
jgi:hypothetical protein